MGALSGAVLKYLVETKSADICDSSIKFHPSPINDKAYSGL